jgi:hypothetical protein
MEMKTLWLFLGLALSTLSSHAEERTALVGVWQLISYQTEFQDGSPKRAMFGEHPTGYIIFTREGRLMAVIEAEGRKAPSTDLDRSTLLKTLISLFRQVPHRRQPVDRQHRYRVEPGVGWHRSGAVLSDCRQSTHGHIDVAASFEFSGCLA